MPHGLSYARNGYRAITTGERKTDSESIETGMCHGGVAVLVREGMRHHIKQVELIGRRVLITTLANKNETTPIDALETYAPRTGYALADKKQHWRISQETIKRIKTTTLFVWRADASRKLGNRTPDDAKLKKSYAWTL